MSQQRPNARRTSKRPTVASGEQKQVSGQSKQSSLQSIRPSNDDHAAWLTYWQKQNQLWRTEPEISPERQAELEECRVLVPDVEKGIYPFKGMKLDRADVEWLLATHEGGPVNWSNEQDREREGLDVRGADLQQADLHQLPLTRLHGGLTFDEWLTATEEQRHLAAVLMGGANLSGAQLEGATLNRAQLKGANLSGAQLEGANLSGAQLEGAILWGAQLEGANLSGAQLEGANLSYAQLEGANLSGAQLEGANLSGAQLEGATLNRAQLKGANLNRAQLKGATLIGAQLKGATLIGAQLEGADLSGAQLEGADLREAQLEGVTLRDATLGNEHHIGPRLADAQWGTINLAVVDWSHVSKLGDEWEALQKMTPSGKKEKHERLNDYRAAVRANRQLAVALQAQGLSEEAARFAYCAQRLQRIVLRRQKQLGQYLFYTFLQTLAGYGYRPIRTVLWYLGILSLFALAYHFFGGLSLYPPDAFVYSLTSFHGRGFFPGLNARPSLHDPLILLAALEAVIGLFIEISFIATFTQRFFGR